MSVTVIVRVAAVWLVGIVDVPVPEPSDPTGKVVVPERPIPLLETVNWALVPATSPLSTVIPVTLMVMEVPGPASAGVSVTVREVYANPLD